jgi:hypothetical protein
MKRKGAYLQGSEKMKGTMALKQPEPLQAGGEDLVQSFCISSTLSDCGK